LHFAIAAAFICAKYFDLSCFRAQVSYAPRNTLQGYE